MKLLKDYDKVCNTNKLLCDAHKKCDILCVSIEDTLRDIIYKNIKDNLVNGAYILGTDDGYEAKDAKDSEIYVFNDGKDVCVRVECSSLEKELIKYLGNDGYNIRFEIVFKYVAGFYMTSIYARLSKDIVGEVGRVRIEERITSSNIKSNTVIKKALNIAKNHLFDKEHYDREIDCDIQEITIIAKAKTRFAPIDTETTGLFITEGQSAMGRR